MPESSPHPESWSLEVGGRRVELRPGETLVGRGSDCDLVLPDGTVSRHHAVLTVSGPTVSLRDLGSSNGTYANGLAVRGEAQLTAGDHLRLGRVHGVLVRGAAEGLGGRLFCRTCGHRVEVGSTACPSCGEDLEREPPLSRSEAVAMSEVMPVGEVLATPARGPGASPYPLGWDEPEGRGPEATDDTSSFHALADLRPEIPGEPREAEPGGAAGRRTEPGPGAKSAPEDEPPETSEWEPPAEAPEREDLAASLWEAARAGRPLFLPAAAFLPRLGAALLDAAWVLAVGLAGVVAAGGPGSPRAVGIGAGLAVLAWGGGSILGWVRWGTTPGKRPFRLFVCDLDGRPGLGTGRAAVRWLACLLSLATLGVGFLRAGLAADHRTLHDLLAGTYVARITRRERGSAATRS